jgi:hypothetical protein
MESTHEEHAMSYGLMLYAVELDKVRAAVGSDDEKLRRSIGGRFKRDIAAADSWFSSAIEGGCPPRYEALRHLIHGAPRVEGYAFQYAYAFKLLVEHYGRFLDNDGFMPIGFDYLEQVNAQLRALGVSAIDVESLAYFHPPVELPIPGDFPGVGYLELETLREGVAQFEAIEAGAIAGIADSFMQTSIQNVRQWCQSCAQQGRGLVSFYH